MFVFSVHDGPLLYGLIISRTELIRIIKQSSGFIVFFSPSLEQYVLLINMLGGKRTFKSLPKATAVHSWELSHFFSVFFPFLRKIGRFGLHNHHYIVQKLRYYFPLVS